MGTDRSGAHGVALALFLPLCPSSPPLLAPRSGKFFIHQKTIDFFQSIVNSILENALKQVAFPDETFKIVGGHVDITNTVLAGVTFQAQEVGLVAPDQLTIDLNDFTGSVTANWEYHTILGIHFGGTADISFAQTSIATLFSFTSNAAGSPVISLDKTDVTIDDLNIKLHGGGAWLWNFIIGLFKHSLINNLESKIDSVAETEFTKVTQAIMAKYPLVIALTGKLFNNTQLNIPLMPTPASAPGGDLPFTMTSDYLVAAGEFQFSSTTNTSRDPRVHDWIPNELPTNPSGTAPMMGLAIDESFVGSALWSLEQNKAFDGELLPSDFKPSSIFQLNTHSISTEYPALYAAYPNNNLTVDFYQYNDAPPSATTSPTGNAWSDAFVAQINVVDPTQPSPIVPVCQLLINFTLDSQFDLDVNATTHEVELKGLISPLVFTAEIIWAGIDPGSFANSVQGLVTALANDLVVPIIDGQWGGTQIRCAHDNQRNGPLCSAVSDSLCLSACPVCPSLCVSLWQVC